MHQIIVLPMCLLCVAHATAPQSAQRSSDPESAIDMCVLLENLEKHDGSMVTVSGVFSLSYSHGASIDGGPFCAAKVRVRRALWNPALGLHFPESGAGVEDSQTSALLDTMDAMRKVIGKYRLEFRARIRGIVDLVGLRPKEGRLSAVPDEVVGVLRIKWIHTK